MGEDQGEHAYLEGQSQGGPMPKNLERGDGITTDVVIEYYGSQDPPMEVQEFGNGWDADLQEMQAMSNNHHQPPLQQQQEEAYFHQNNNGRCFDSAMLPAETLYNPTPDLLNLFHLAKCTNGSSPSMFPGSSSVPLANTNDRMATNGPDILSEQGLLAEPYLLPGGHADGSWSSSSILYDPLFRPNQAPPQPTIMKELFQSLPFHGHYDLNVISSGGDEGVGRGMAYDEENGNARKYEKQLLDFGTDMDAWETAVGIVLVHVHFHYILLQSDRASVVGDAIDYIQELKRTVNELRLLAERKRHGKQRNRRLLNELSDGVGDVDGESTITKRARRAHH